MSISPTGWGSTTGRWAPSEVQALGQVMPAERAPLVRAEAVEGQDREVGAPGRGRLLP